MEGLRSISVSATLRHMAGEFRYRGRVISAAEVEFIRQLIAAHPSVSRRQLSMCVLFSLIDTANGVPTGNL